MPRASITSPRDFRRVYRSGTKARSDGLTVWVASRAEDGPSRLGMAVRSGVGSAVARNRLRRRLRELFRSLDVVPGNDVVVSASPEAAGRNFQELREVLTGALTKAGALQ